KPPRHDYDDRADYETGVNEGYAAAIAITGWSGDNLKMSIKPEGKPTGDAPFTVAVRIKNTSGQELAHHPYINLSTAAALEGTEAANYEDAEVAIERIENEPAKNGESDDSTEGYDSRAFRRGETMVARYRITPKKSGLGKLTFLASAFESDDAPGPTTAGAMDARTFKLSETKPQVAAK